MSISYAISTMDKNLDKFANSVTELQHRVEGAFQGQQRRISDLEQRPVFDVATIKHLIREVLAEHRLIDQRNDSAGPHTSSPTSSAVGTSSLCARCRATPLCAQCHGPLNRSPIILASFEERSNGADPMDMRYTPVAPIVDAGVPYFSRSFSAEDCSSREAAEGSHQEMRPPTSVPPHTNGVTNHQVHPTRDYSPNTWE